MNRNVKTYTKNGKSYAFNFTFFNNTFKNVATEKSLTYGEFEQEFAEAIYVEKSTIHAWRNRRNAPGDLEKIEMAASFLEIDSSLLLVETLDSIGDNKMNKTNVPRKLEDRERDALRRIYLQILKYLDEVEEYYSSLVKKDQDYEDHLTYLWEATAFYDPADPEEANEMYDDYLYEIENSDYREDVLRSISKTLPHRTTLNNLNKILLKERIDLPLDLYQRLNDILENFEGTINYIHSDSFFITSCQGVLYSEVGALEKENGSLEEAMKIGNERAASRRSLYQTPDMLEALKDAVEGLFEKDEEFDIDKYAKRTSFIYQVHADKEEYTIQHKNQLYAVQSFIVSAFHEEMGTILEEYN